MSTQFTLHLHYWPFSHDNHSSVSFLRNPFDITNDMKIRTKTTLYCFDLTSKKWSLISSWIQYGCALPADFLDYYRHYNDVIMTTMASEITSLTIVYSTVCSGPDQRKQQSSMSLAFVRGIHLWLVNSPHKWPVTWKMFPIDDVIMEALNDCHCHAQILGSTYLKTFTYYSKFRLMFNKKNWLSIHDYNPARQSNPSNGRTMLWPQFISLMDIV